MSTEPTVILVSTKLDDTIIDRFEQEGKNRESQSGDNDQFRLPFILEVRPPSEFYYDVAKGKLANLRLGEQNDTRFNLNIATELTAVGHEQTSAVGQQEQLLRLAGLIDMESRVTV